MASTLTQAGTFTIRKSEHKTQTIATVQKVLVEIFVRTIDSRREANCCIECGQAKRGNMAAVVSRIDKNIYGLVHEDTCMDEAYFELS